MVKLVELVHALHISLCILDLPLCALDAQQQLLVVRVKDGPQYIALSVDAYLELSALLKEILLLGYVGVFGWEVQG